MTDAHPDMAPQLRLLARGLLNLITPAMEAVAAFAPPADGAATPCAQVWCPLCAAAAVASGEHHPLAAVLAEHGSAVLALIRELAGADESGPSPGSPPSGPHEPPSPPSSRYEHISITVYE